MLRSKEFEFDDKGAPEVFEMDNPVVEESLSADEQAEAEDKRQLRSDPENPAKFTFDAASDDATVSVVIALFKELDADASGSLDADELVTLMQRLNRPSDPLSVSRMLNEMWLAGGGTGPRDEITMESFVECDRRTTHLTPPASSSLAATRSHRAPSTFGSSYPRAY